ncbi:hypothetical protein H6G95_25105 [Nostoc linckia FACHB-391]|uniref:Uncharacterized protein n=1 Tax=Nostoc linckia FACHB-391 TaxID=2692906 RepID=A0ABR8F4R7_NOSLI|nr:hypothetical protein [Nostoc linckia FACHB-391]
MCELNDDEGDVFVDGVLHPLLICDVECCILLQVLPEFVPVTFLHFRLGIELDIAQNHVIRQLICAH